MNVRGFMKVGHPPTLFCAFLYFDISFMVWVLLGALANSIAPDLELDDAQRGLMVALPLLGGSILRIILGILTDHIGGKRTAMLGLCLTALPLLLGWLWADDYGKILVVGLLLGIAGASFAAALPLAGRWYPPQYQGLVLGIAGAGNSGTALATFFAPQLVPIVGWHGVFGLALIPILLMLIVFALLAKDSPQQPAPKPLSAYAAVLNHRDAWLFCFFYSVTFGGFVGLASFLNSYFTIQFGVSAATAGVCASLCVIAGSMLRPLGGYLADRFGGVRVLASVYFGVSLLFFAQLGQPSLYVATALLVAVMALLGMGNGAVFQLVPQRFPKEIGVVTGIVGAAGGVGGFCLPTILGILKEWTNSFSGGFLLFGAVGILSALTLIVVSKKWIFTNPDNPAPTEAAPTPEGVMAPI